MTAMSRVPADGDVRERALALERSFIVRAPAGSGKTDLLTRRFLKLLAAVDEPEEILAITFTRAATAEMRARVLGYLEEAAQGELSLMKTSAFPWRVRRWRSPKLEDGSCWNSRIGLNIETIDSLCLRIAHNQPLLSRMGGRLSPSENAAPLYAQAARRTLGLLGSAEPNSTLRSHICWSCATIICLTARG